MPFLPILATLYAAMGAFHAAEHYCTTRDMGSSPAVASGCALFVGLTWPVRSTVDAARRLAERFL